MRQDNRVHEKIADYLEFWKNIRSCLGGIRSVDDDWTDVAREKMPILGRESDGGVNSPLDFYDLYHDFL